MSKISFFLVALVAVFFSNTYAYPRVSKSHDANDVDDNAGISDDYTNDEAADYDEYSDENLNYTGSPPALISEPGNFTVNIGDTVYLPCNVSNSDEYASMWFKRSTVGSATLLYQDKFKVSPSKSITMYPNKTLVVAHASKDDTGEYRCKISSEPPLELVHHITVQYPARIVNMQPNNSIQVDLHSHLNLMCEVEGEPTPEVTWSKDGHVLYKNDQNLPSHVYEIPSVKPHDAGTYQCLAVSKIGRPAHDSVKVQVLHSPTIRVENSVVTTAENYISQLSCIVHAFPEPIVEWFKNDVRLSEEKRFNATHRNNHHYLQISRTKQTDFGKYTCAAKNPQGASKADIVLTGAPAPAEFIKVEAAPDQRNTFLQWMVESYNPISEYELQYRKAKDSEWITLNDIEVFTPLGNSYTVNHTIKDLDAGQYVTRLRAKNSYGWSSYSTAKEFTGEPVPANISDSSSIVFPSPLALICTYVFITVFRYN